MKPGTLIRRQNRAGKVSALHRGRSNMCGGYCVCVWRCKICLFPSSSSRFGISSPFRVSGSVYPRRPPKNIFSAWLCNLRSWFSREPSLDTPTGSPRSPPTASSLTPFSRPPETRLWLSGSWTTTTPTTVTHSSASRVTVTLSPTLCSPRTATTPFPAHGTRLCVCGTWMCAKPLAVLRDTPTMCCRWLSRPITVRSSLARVTNRLSCGTLWLNASTPSTSQMPTLTGSRACDSRPRTTIPSSSVLAGIAWSRYVVDR